MLGETGSTSTSASWETWSVSPSSRIDTHATLRRWRVDRTTVETVRFTGDGCTLSQAGASLLSEQMVGVSVSLL
ncbi:hypothetical protein EXE51_06340 [Halorubrum sp. CGM5_25_10-8B]|nr:iron-sulfur cluster assembly scaffold protein [Halorubrum ezzemoulense]TKX37705.1 hypothetical protein EXE51_06340 [Halorubrum sp. CGM5_25_10-8B]